MGKLRTLAAALLALTAFAPALSAQERGTVAGRVTATENGAAISGASVRVQGTTRQTVTDAGGNYRITAVAPGSYSITVSVIGRQPGSQTVNVAGGQTATANFQLRASAVMIEGITVNPITGQAERRREAGTNTSNIQVADLNRGPITKFADVITGRTSGVTLQGVAGTTGTSQRIRIRGANSLSLSNDPLIYIDGVLATNGRGGIATGGQQFSRLNDINTEDIENIEILKGPAASALYGTAAANGVVLITTRRGRAGQTTWRGYAEVGQVEDRNPYPPNFMALQVNNDALPPYDTTWGEVNGANLGVGNYAPCRNESFARDVCRQDMFLSFNQLRDSRTSPYSVGQRNKVGMNVSGGANNLTYYISADRDHERGVIEWNTVDRTTLRTNLNAQLRSDLTVQVNAGYTNSDVALPQGDNNIFSPLIVGLLGTAQYIPGMERQFALGEYRKGNWFGQNNQDIRKTITNQLIDRFVVGANTNYRPASWLSLNANTGLDFYSRFDHETVQPGELDYFPGALIGYRQGVRSNNYQYTLNGSGVATFDVSSAVASTTTLGASFQRAKFSGIECYGEGIIRGTESCSATTKTFSISESYTDDRVFGAFAREELAFNDRIFLAASLRGDRNSGLVDDFILYPSASLSWVVSDEPFFPQGFVSNLRVRTAVGQSGLRPSFGQAETFFGPRSVQIGGEEQLGAIITQTGNENLKPERTTEYELGFDAGFLNDRLSADFTYFNKRSEDALVSRNLAPSQGLTGSVFENLGSVKNWGTELGLNARVVERSDVALNLRLQTTTLRNRIEDLGVNPVTGEPIAPISLNRGLQQHRSGYPVGGYFQLPIRFEDLDGDGVLARNEVFVDSSRFITDDDGNVIPLAFIGPSLPTNTQAFSGDLTLFRYITVSTLFERRAGHKQANATEQFRCTQQNSYPYIGLCGAMGDPNASLEDQARFIARNLPISAEARTVASNDGYIEDADFIKWRELSVRLGVPESLGRRFRALQGASLTLSGRNLKTWTDYTGLDPEINETGAGTEFTQGEFNTQPPVRYFTARFDFTF